MQARPPKINLDDIFIQYDNKKLEHVRNVLLQSDLMTAGWICTKDQLYDYSLGQSLSSQFKTKLIADRMIVSSIVTAMQGKTTSHQIMKSAAIMAFTRICGFQFDCSRGLSELFDNQGQEACDHDTAYLALSQLVPLDVWLDLACDGVNRIEKYKFDTVDSWTNYPDDYFLPNYVACLKIVEMAKESSGNAEDNVTNFINWMDKEFIFCPNAIIFAFRFFGCDDGNKNALMRGLWTNDYSTLKKCARNAAWDVSHFGYYIASTRYSADRYLFASLDAKLWKIIDSITNFNNRPFHEFVAEWWGSKKGNSSRCSNFYINHPMISSAHRMLKKPSLIMVEQSIVEGERKLLKFSKR